MTHISYLTSHNLFSHSAMDKGIYCLVLRLAESRAIQIGRLGCGLFTAGYYVYVGSALNSLRTRIGRHLKSEKKKHWHIDYFVEHARIIAVRAVVLTEPSECLFSGKVRNISQHAPMKGFGSSDCSCLTHLHFFSENPLSNPRFEIIWR